MPMDHAALTARYAELILRVGVNLEEGQVLRIRAQPEQAGFVRALAEAAYAAGAAYVYPDFFDNGVKAVRLRHQDAEQARWVPPLFESHFDAAIAGGWANVSLVPEPETELFRGIAPDRLAADTMPRTPGHHRMIGSGRVNWAVVAYPSAEWAEDVYGSPDVDRLWREFAACVRLDADDPVAAWHDHVAELRRRAAALTARRFRAIEFEGPGTMLRVGLLPESIFVGGPHHTEDGREFVPNLPTEECFSAPDCHRVEGHVRATRPLFHLGAQIEDLELRFEGGRCVSVSAADEASAELVRREMAEDPGACRLGEVALVDRSSRVFELGTVFRNTLFDENATCHVAWGQAYALSAPGIPEDQAEARGLNQSAVHTDVMIGGPEVDVRGVDASGSTVPIITGNVWQLDG